MQKNIIFAIIIIMVSCNSQNDIQEDVFNNSLENIAKCLLYKLNYSIEVGINCKDQNSILELCFKSYNQAHLEGVVFVDFNYVNCNTGEFTEPCFPFYTGIGFDVKDSIVVKLIKRHDVIFDYNSEEFNIELINNEIDFFLKQKNIDVELLQSCIST